MGTILLLLLLCLGVHADAKWLANPRQLLNGAQQPPTPSNKTAIVLARFREDISWLELYLPLTAHFVYQIGDKTQAAYGTTLNTCGESLAYLTGIIDHYESLPEAALFAHAHR